MPRTRWLLPDSDPHEVAALARALGVRPAAAAVLHRRGYRDASSARKFLNPSLDDLHDPFLLADMDKAVDRLRRAIAERQPIRIYGDYDVDGTMSVVILRRAIQLAGGIADYKIPDRVNEGYGMRTGPVEQAAADGVKLIVSVDTGIRAAEVVAHAAGLGIDVIVTDHHLPERELPRACAVINPNRPDCGYPNKNLCGVGVAYKLIDALLRGPEWPEDRRRRTLDSFLKLTAIGTVADVVPLTGENRAIVKHGLAGLLQVRNPGMRALFEKVKLTGKAPSAMDVMFRVAPRINAAGRLDVATRVIDLLEASDPETAERLAAELHHLNAERKEIQDRATDEILSGPPPGDGQRALVYYGSNWHEGVVGIVANRVMEEYWRPAFVLTDSAEPGIVKGSGRSIPRFHLLQALESMADVFVRFGGHHHAAGVTLQASRVDEFRERLNAYAAAVLGADDLVKEVEIDAVVPLTEINGNTAADLFALEPIGCGNGAPVLALRGVEIAAVSPLGQSGKHFAITVRQGLRTLRVKAWNLSTPPVAASAVDMAVTIERDDHSAERGYEPWSVRLVDLPPAAAAVSAPG